MLYWHYRHAVEFSKNTRTPSPNTEVPDDRGVIPSYCIVLQALPQGVFKVSIRAAKRQRKNLAPFWGVPH